MLNHPGSFPKGVIPGCNTKNLRLLARYCRASVGASCTPWRGKVHSTPWQWEIAQWASNPYPLACKRVKRMSRIWRVSPATSPLRRWAAGWSLGRSCGVCISTARANASHASSCIVRQMAAAWGTLAPIATFAPSARWNSARTSKGGRRQPPQQPQLQPIQWDRATRALAWCVCVCVCLCVCVCVCVDDDQSSHRWTLKPKIWCHARPSLPRSFLVLLFLGQPSQHDASWGLTWWLKPQGLRVVVIWTQTSYLDLAQAVMHVA